MILLGIGLAVGYFWKFGIKITRFPARSNEYSLNTKHCVIAGIILVVFFFTPVPLTIVPPGNVGVLTFFGKVYDVVPEGISIVNPLAYTNYMSIRTQEMFEHEDSPSKEGLNVTLEVSMLYHLMPDKAKVVFQNIGMDYANIVVKPTFRSAIRAATVHHEAKDLYTSGREIIASQIQKDVTDDLALRGIVVEKILLRKIQLPATVTNAIDQKLAADQQSQQMQFVLTKEKQEAERKRIEAQGIQDFQRIVSQGISEQLLKWKGIEATEKLALSNNAKVVIVGGKDGLPVILNTSK